VAAVGAASPLHRSRRVATLPGRLHVELRALDHDELVRFAAVVEPALRGLAGVDWAEIHAVSHRLVVACRPPATEEAVVAIVDGVERSQGLADRAFPDSPTHAGDREPLLADVAGIAADLVGIGVGSLARVMRVTPPPIEVDLTVALSVIDQVVPIHRAVQSRVGKPATDLAVGFGNSVLSALVAGPAAPATDLAKRVLILREIEGRRRAWYAAEQELFAEPPGTGTDRLIPPDRPVPLPDGPIEVYSRRAVGLSALAVAATLVGNRRVEDALGLLYTGLPKAAAFGREGFAAQTGRALADRGFVPMDLTTLRLLDRVDYLVVEASLVGDRGDQVPHALLKAAAAGSDVGLVVTTSQAAAAGAEVPSMLEVVQGLQRQGHVVAAAAGIPDEGLAAADLGVGIKRPGSPVPWGAHLMATGDPADLVLIVRAVGEARRVSRESARMAAAGSGLGALLSLANLPGARMSPVPNASTLATAVALANGYRRAAALAREQAPLRADPTPWHAMPPAEVLAALGTTPIGLTAADAEQRRRPEQAAHSFPVALVKAIGTELANPLTPVLAAGAGLSAMAGSAVDAVLVSSVVLGNGILGGSQRVRADRAAAALIRQRPQHVRVVRDGREMLAPPRELVRGDLIRLRAGQAIPADCRILSALGLEVDESALTGESLPVAKGPDAVQSDVVAERSSMLYEGTWVASGQVEAVVVASGEETEARRAILLAGTPPDAGVEAQLSQWTDRILPLALGGGAAMVVNGLLHSRPLRDTLGTGVSLAVAAVPEGLPLLATAAQLAAARRLARCNVLVRNARAVEALGRVDILCADKTGTLTEGHIVLKKVSDGTRDADADHLDDTLRTVLAVAVRATPIADDPADLPHPTDRAVARAARTHRVDPTGGNGGWVPDGELPFAPERGFHAASGPANGGRVLAVKGAPEAVLPRCTHWIINGRRTPLGAKRRATLHEHVDVLAGQGLRVLAVAEAAYTGNHANGEIPDDAVTGLTLHGLVALADPARDSAAQAVDSLKAAGVEVLMITGDHPSTALGIGVELGLLTTAEDMLTGADIDTMTDDELAGALRTVRVVARVTPAHKVRIVGALQSVGRVVAMTGDGANDAPAIRLADVGIALGRRGTTAAQSAADMIVLDDRIETLVQAVIEGRALWGSVRDAVAMLVGGNIGEIAFTVLGSAISGVPPMNARQLLLVNLLTDALPALAIAARRPSRVSPASLLQEGPDRSLGDPLTRAVIGNAVGVTVATGSAWLVARFLGPPAWARSVAMSALIGTQLGQALSVAGNDPIVMISAVGSVGVLVLVVQTPGVGTFFGCTPLGPLGWSLALGCAAAGATISRIVPGVLPEHILGDPPADGPSPA
jgi:cation-transporting ATPase I